MTTAQQRMISALPCLDPERNSAVQTLEISLVCYARAIAVVSVVGHTSGLWSAKLKDYPEIEVVFTAEQFQGFRIVRNRETCAELEIYELDDLIAYGGRA